MKRSKKNQEEAFSNYLGGNSQHNYSTRRQIKKQIAPIDMEKYKNNLKEREKQNQKNKQKLLERKNPPLSKVGSAKKPHQNPVLDGNLFSLLNYLHFYIYFICIYC